MEDSGLVVFSEGSYAESAYGLSGFLQQHNEMVHCIKALHASFKACLFHNLTVYLVYINKIQQDATVCRYLSTAFSKC